MEIRVTGPVRNSGIYRVPAGSTVSNIVRTAGGLKWGYRFNEQVKADIETIEITDKGDKGIVDLDGFCHRIKDQKRYRFKRSKQRVSRKGYGRKYRKSRY